MLTKVKVPAKSVELGMFVVELDRPWTEVPLSFQKFEISCEDEIRIIQEYCKYVFIEIDINEWQKKSSEFNKKQQSKLPENTPFHHELARAHSIYFRAKEQIATVFENAELIGLVDLSSAESLVKDCVASILSNANALFWLSHIRDKNNFTVEHSLRVSILAIAMGKFLELPRHQLELLGLAGMLHDLGKVQIPKEIIDKPFALSAAEERVMQKHVSLGYELIHKDTTIHSVVKDVILNHHQHIDGSGYPKMQAGTELSLACKIIAIIDRYDTLTSDTPRSKGVSAKDAMHEIFLLRDKHFDKQLVESFIKMLGIYPPGTLVQMQNHEIGFVISSDPEKKLLPKVELIMNARGKLQKSIIIDLSKKPKDSNGAQYQIRKSLPDGALDIDLHNYIRETHHIGKLI